MSSNPLLSECRSACGINDEGFLYVLVQVKKQSVCTQRFVVWKCVGLVYSSINFVFEYSFYLQPSLCFMSEESWTFV